MKQNGLYPYFSCIILLALLLSIPKWSKSQIFQSNPNPPIGDMQIKGQKLGAIKGANGEKIDFIGFNYVIKAPQNSGTGNVPGKRVHKPLILVKEWDESSPQLLEAMITGEPMEIIMEFNSTKNVTGLNILYQTIRLHNARIVEISNQGGAYANDKSSLPGKVHEEISLTFQSMEMINPYSKIPVIDNWE